jgi:RsiW-degrading membrane proteinase PrsW (M82 family)
MQRVFLGKPIHWLIIAIVIAVLWWMGDTRLHTRDFKQFLLILAVLAAGAVIAILASARPGDRVTREPLDRE